MPRSRRSIRSALPPDHVRRDQRLVDHLGMLSGTGASLVHDRPFDLEMGPGRNPLGNDLFLLVIVVATAPGDQHCLDRFLISLGRLLFFLLAIGVPGKTSENKNKQTLGIISDGDIKRISNKNNDIKKLIAKNIMKKNPITVDKNMIAAEALSIMNSKKVTCLCVHTKKNKRKTLGIITVHNILNANIQ